jgi:hypothetical protein
MARGRCIHCKSLTVTVDGPTGEGNDSRAAHVAAAALAGYRMGYAVEIPSGKPAGVVIVSGEGRNGRPWSDPWTVADTSEALVCAVCLPLFVEHALARANDKAA